MTNPYGPWATAVDAGRNPQLSAFWKQRLTLLVAASQTSPVLSWRNLLALLAAAVLTCVLPTFRLAPAMAEDGKPAESRKEPAPNTAQEKSLPPLDQKLSAQRADRDQGKKEKKDLSAAEAAQRAYEAALAAYNAGDGDIEAVYRWSQRWMQAEQAERGDAAIQSHLDRMQTLCKVVTELYEWAARGGETTAFCSARYYVVEAKEMLKKAKTSPRNRAAKGRD